MLFQSVHVVPLMGAAGSSFLRTIRPCENLLSRASNMHLIGVLLRASKIE